MTGATVGQRLREIRKEKGLTQPVFARSIGISQGHLSEMESGKTSPTEPILIAIEYRYSIKKDWLLTGEGPMKRESKEDVHGVKEEHHTVFEKEYLEKLLIILRYKDAGTRSAITQNIDTFLRVPGEGQPPQKKRKAAGNDGG